MTLTGDPRLPPASNATGGVNYRRISVGEVSLAVAEMGSGDPVVLLHGFPELARSWRHQMPAVAAEGLQAVAPDLRGCGGSDRPTEVSAYALPRLVEDAVGLIDVLGGRAHLVGHDWGGIVAWAAAAADPGRVLSLTAMNAPHPDAFFEALVADDAGDQRQRLWYMLLYQFPGVAERWLSERDFANLRARFARSAPGTFSAEDIEAYVEALRRPGALSAGLNLYRAIVPPEAWVEPPPAYGAVRVPTLVVWGEADQVLRPRLLEGSLRRVDGPLRVARLPEVGHYVQQEAPDAVNQALIGALREWRSR